MQQRHYLKKSMENKFLKNINPDFGSSGFCFIFVIEYRWFGSSMEEQQPSRSIFSITEKL